MSQSLTRVTKTPSSKDRLARWYVIDAEGKVLGRVASLVAELIIGKGKPSYTPGQDSGDHVIVLNAKDVAVTGRKEAKEYFRHSGYPGGVKITTLSKLRGENPGRIILEAVSGMLPKNRMRSRMLRRLHISPDSKHEFSDHKPVEVTIG